MQNTEFINVQAKQQFETDGSLLIKVCYRWKISTNSLPHHTSIKTPHKIQIILYCYIAPFFKKDIFAIILQCQISLIL